MSDVKLAALGAVAAAVAAASPVPPEILGAPLPLLLAAFAGALFALAQTPPAKWGSLLSLPTGFTGWQRYVAGIGRGAGIMLALTSVAFVSAWTLALAPHFWVKLKDAPLAPGAGLVAYGFQHVVPRAFAALGRRIDAWGGKTPAPAAPAPAAEEPGRE